MSRHRNGNYCTWVVVAAGLLTRLSRCLFANMHMQCLGANITASSSRFVVHKTQTYIRKVYPELSCQPARPMKKFVLLGLISRARSGMCLSFATGYTTVVRLHVPRLHDQSGRRGA